jgi:3-oxoadipate enol-lactonase
MDIPSSSGLRSPGLSKNRGRWLGNDPSSYATVYAMLVATEMHDEPASAQLSEARDRRQPRSHRPAHLAKAVANIVPRAVIFDRIDAFVRAVAA